MQLDYLNFLFKSESVFCFACNRVAQLVILRPFTLRQGVYRHKRREANICARKQKKETKRSVAYRFTDIQFSSRDASRIDRSTFLYIESDDVLSDEGGA